METEKSIFIRTDGNPEIATGHLMRCLSVARALRDKKARVHFVMADETSAGLLRSFFCPRESFPAFLMNSDFREPEAELDSLASLCARHSAGAMLVDSYFVTPAYLETLRDMTKTAYIDDLYAFDYPVDLLVNYDAVVPRDFYHQAGRRLLGLAYTPLRKQFSGLVPNIRPRVKEILISTGGTDPYHAAESLIRVLTASPVSESWRFHVLAGSMHSGRRALEQLALTHPNLLLYDQVSHMAPLMQRCDMAVSAAGTTLYELCAAGIPAVSFTMADNQLTTARQLEASAGIPYAGDIRTHRDFVSHLCDILYRLSSDFGERKTLSLSMHHLIDGNGAGRIADALIQLLHS